jgi:hypothetical protein
MEGREKPHTDKYKEIMNDWNYDVSCTLTSLLVWDLDNFKHLIFVAQSVQEGLQDRKAGERSRKRQTGGWSVNENNVRGRNLVEKRKMMYTLACETLCTRGW